MDDPRNFAAGIYEALYTTAFGLVVAIPLLIIYHMLRNHADSIMREVEARALAFISAASNRAETQRASRYEAAPARSAAPAAAPAYRSPSDVVPTEGSDLVETEALAESEDTSVEASQERV